MAQGENKQGTQAAGLPLLMALFALHTFLLMGMGTWSDLAMAGEGFATTLYFAREAVLAAGFLLYALFAHLKKPSPLSGRAADIAGIVLAVLFACCAFALQVSGPPAVRASAVLAIALIVGVSGGMVYERIALAAGRSEAPSGSRALGDASRTLGVIVGGGGALAVASQYVLQNSLAIGGWLAVLFVACFALLVWLARALRPGHPGAYDAESPSVHESSALPATTLACLVVASACLFLLLPIYEIAMRASGDLAPLYEWHRLFLAAGYGVIGAAAYVGGRPAASVAALVSALFAVIIAVQTTMLQAGPLTTILFYTLLGTSLAWSAVAFMSAAPQYGCPALVASMGRILVALVTLSESLVQTVDELPMMGVLASSLVLLAVVVIAMVRGGLLEFAKRVGGGPEANPAPTAEERLCALAAECNLTVREQEVLAALVLTESKNQQIADELGISRRQLQTHIARIYEKTGTSTRAGLVARIT